MTYKLTKPTISAVAFLAAISVANPAMTQSVSVDAGASALGAEVEAGTGISASKSGADANVSANADVNTPDVEVGANATAGSRISAIEDADARVSAIAGLSAKTSVDGADANVNGEIDFTQVAIIDVEEAFGADAESDLAISLAANAEGLTDIRTNVSGNAELVALLEAEGFEADDVVGIQTTADGATEVFVADGVVNVTCANLSVSGDAASDDQVASANGALITALSDCDGTSVGAAFGGSIDAVAENEELTTDLQLNGYTVADVVGVTFLGEGTVNLYVETDS